MMLSGLRMLVVRRMMVLLVLRQLIVLSRIRRSLILVWLLRIIPCVLLWYMSRGVWPRRILS